MDNKYTKEFVVDVTGEKTGERFQGKFTVKTRLSFREQLRRDEIRRQLLGSNPASPSDHEAAAAEMLAELAIRILPDQMPSWWKNAENGLELADDTVLRTVYNLAMEAELELVKSLTEKGEAAKKDLQANQPQLT